jgi:alpha-ketoglutaric semialdehyde dehydrogenase
VTSTNQISNQIELTGQMIIGGELLTGSGEPIHGVDPRTGQRLDPAYPSASRAELDRACELAEQAFPHYRDAPISARADFLDDVADRIDALGERLVDRAVRESGLAQGRLTGELARTTGQLRLFGAVLREGNWHGARIDHGDPSASPAKPDIRQRKVPLGPVAVFGASNFPLAFSVAGGDTAAALAAGCPVVVKAHEAHPGTCELVGRAVAEAVRAADLPGGVFSMVYGDGPGVGTQLVTHPCIQAVGFTGSRAAGLAIAKAAFERPRSIPVYAEMSSVNPVFLLPGVLAARGAELGTAFVGSLTLGAGQFCTNPGLVFAPRGPELDAFLDSAAKAVEADAGAPMLTPRIAEAYHAGVERLTAHPGVTVLARGQRPDGPAGGQAVLAMVDAADFTDSLHEEQSLQQEVFGATSLVVRCESAQDLVELARSLEGQLTATVHAEESDYPLVRRLLPVLERLAGRVLFGGWPTGVQVCHAMVHGGPFPATSDSRTTSVGTRAIERFLRPVCYQDAPAELLPEVLREDTTVPRRVDGRLVV